MVHDKIKNAECPECEFKCNQKGTLVRHIKMVHDKIKNVECPECEFKCNQKGTLVRHIKMVHDKIKNVECPDCEFKCSQKGTLVRHIRMVHDKIKNVECPDCEFKCSQKGTLLRHKTYHCNKGVKSSKSAGELKVKALLEKYKIDYVFNCSHNNLRSYEDKGLVRFDFCIPLIHKKSFIFIEFDGIQHERPSRFGSQTYEECMEKFKRLQQNDRIKDKYCKDMNYPLLRIKYNNTSIEYTILEFVTNNAIVVCDEF